MAGLIDPVFLEASQKERASEVLTEAFHDDPMWTTIFPDSTERARSLGWLWEALMGYCLVYGEVYTTAEVRGAACWLSPGNTELNFWRSLRTGLGFMRAVMKYEGDSRRRFLDAVDYMDKVHKSLMKRPHWYLWALGVAPEYQGQGIGGTLIQPVLARSDAEGLPCYLETQNEANVAFYQKRGFEVLSETGIPGQDVRVWAMLKEPR